MEDHEHQERTARAYAVMEKKQADAIVRQLAGQDVGDLIYDIPFADNGKESQGGAWRDCGDPNCYLNKRKTPHYHSGRIECQHDNCRYKRQGRHHTHIVGIGAQGVDELARMYEGIVAIPIRWRMVTDRSKRYWEVAVLAVDSITCATRVSVYRQKADAPRDASDLRGDFGFSIAQHKAKRNAISEILPAEMLNEVKRLARSGKMRFTPEDARDIMEPYIQARLTRTPRINLMELLVTANTGQVPLGATRDLQHVEDAGMGEPAGLPPPREPAPPARKPAKASKPPPKKEPPRAKPKPAPTFAPDSVIPGGQFAGQTWRAVLQSDLGYVKRLSEKAPNGWGKCAKDALVWWEKNKPEEPPIGEDGSFPVLEGEDARDGRGTAPQGNETPPASPEHYADLFAKAGKHEISKDELDTEAQIRYGRPCDELTEAEVSDLNAWIG